MRILSQDPKNIAKRAEYPQQREKRQATAKKWRLANPDKFAASKRDNYVKNREKRDKQSQSWRLNNRDRYLAYAKASAARRRAAILKATPKWLNAVQLEELKQIYWFCPDGYEVDHIVPLQGKSVRGLHVPWNLQYLPMRVNRTKGSRYEGQ